MKKQSLKNTTWDLSILYTSVKDPQIEMDIVNYEKMTDAFAKRFDTLEKKYLADEDALLEVSIEYEKMYSKIEKPFLYYYYQRDIDGKNPVASSQIPLLENRLTKSFNKLKFFDVSLGAISMEKQKEFLASKKLQHFRFMLECVFSDAKHFLSISEEKIMALKALPAREMWISHNDRILGSQTILWKGKTLPVAAAFNMVAAQKTAKDRQKLWMLLMDVMKSVAAFSEGEINAVMTDKKINDELRGYATPYESTVRHYRNDPAVVEKLVRVVTENYLVAHRFYKLKAKLLKQKKLSYADRGAKIGVIKTTFSYEDSFAQLNDIFGSVDKKYSTMLSQYVAERRIDVLPRQGKKGGAYCWGSFYNPTFVLLNHVNDMHSFTTFAHEMGHAFHTELSKSQGVLYNSYSTSLAETASTLFESIASEAVIEKLSDKEKIIALHDRINDDIATIFRQIAGFNFELDLHTAIRSKGFVSKEEIAEMHNKNMKAYLGPIASMSPDDGYFFVTWSHIRRFFYVYSYAYGMLVSKALLRRYRKDKTFWTSIEKFLSAGGKDTPENILKEIGIDVSSPEFFQEGIDEILDNVILLEKLTKK